MPRLPRIGLGEVIAALERFGVSRVRTKGSHLVMQRVDSTGRRLVCVVPLHDEVAVGTLRSISRQGGIDPDDVVRAL